MLFLIIHFLLLKVENAGQPPSSENNQFCLNQAVEETVTESSMLIESQGYPVYPSSDFFCVRNITAPSSDLSLEVYLTDAGFPGTGTAP